MPENKLLLGNLTEGFCLFKTAFDFFYDMDPFMTQAPILKRKKKQKKKTVEGLEVYRNIFREMEKQKVIQKLQCVFVKLH